MVATTQSYRVDVHHHFAPPCFVKELDARGLLHPPLRNWQLSKTIEELDRGGVQTAAVSMTTGVWLESDASARRLARECNEYVARIASDRPGKFGLFAILPMPDIEGSLHEIEYALDVLGADGIGLLTSYAFNGGKEKWLGDDVYAPIFEELNRRAAVVFSHPVCPTCMRGVMPGIPVSMIEYAADTTRAIAQMIQSGSARRYPHMETIFTHAGGAMPMLIERFLNVASETSAALGDGEHASEVVLGTLAKFFYDTAQASNEVAMTALRSVVPVTQILFGTDFPYRTAEKHITQLRKGVFSESELLGIERENILRLLPSLGSNGWGAKA